jgi:hypothetical protein
MSITGRQDHYRRHNKKEYHVAALYRTNVLNHYSTFVPICKRQFLVYAQDAAISGCRVRVLVFSKDSVKADVMPKRCLWILSWVLGICLLSSGMAPVVTAAGPTLPAEPLLLALDRPASITLSAYSAIATLDCGAPGCTLSVSQTYWLHNKSPDQAVSFQIGLAADDTTWPGENVTLKLAGNTLVPLNGNESFSAMWSLSLQPDEHQVLVLTYLHTTIKGPLLALACDLGRLADVWGIPEGVRVMLTLPEAVSDEAVLWMMPFNSLFDGRNVTWDYETPGELGNHQVVIMLPAAWHTFSQARSENNHLQLASLYLGLEQAALTLHLSDGDYFGLAIAEYQAAIADRPDDPSVHQLLAQAYLDRANSQPLERLNYELLAAHELELAHKLAPEDGNIATSLARTYYTAALASSEQGSEASALSYLELARAPGLPAVESDEKLQSLALQWSITLAEKGSVQIAFNQGGKLLPQNILQLLQDYAPPFTSIQTVVATDPGLRQVSYQLGLYAPSAAQTITQVHTIIDTLNTIPEVEASSSVNEQRVDIEVSVRYNTFIELSQRITEINRIFGEDKSLLSLALKEAWNSTPEQMGLSTNHLRTGYFYREQIDASALQQAWQEQSQYAQWRLTEVASLPNSSELTLLQQRLANYMLREQQQVWRQLPAYSLWTYRVALGQAGVYQGEWILTWGQNRTLELNTTVYNTTMLNRLLVVSLVILALIVLFLLVPWKYLVHTNNHTT